MDDKAHRPAEPDQDGDDREKRVQALADLAARPLEERVGERMRRALRGMASKRPVRRVLHHLTCPRPAVAAGSVAFGVPCVVPVPAAGSSPGLRR